MKTIRVGYFETNSSSTHSITMCMKADYERWEKGEVLFDLRFGKLVTREEAIESLKKNKQYQNIDWDNQDEVNDALEEDFLIKKAYYDRTEGECYVEEFTTPSGDVIVAFGEKGRD